MKKAILLILLLPMLATAQYFDVFDIDTTDYPIMKAKFYSIDANGKQILNHTPADFEITENGEPRDVISVSCPISNDEPFSVVIVVDVSGSMSGESIENAKIAIKSFIDMIPKNGSEVAIIAFNSSNFYVNDFSMDKEELKSNIENLITGGGTDFDAAFINPVAGALLALEKAKHTNRNIIVVTDGIANGNESAIKVKSKSLNARVFSLLIHNSISDSLQNISESTNGKTYESLITKKDFESAFEKVSRELFNFPCQISWKSKVSCTTYVDLKVENFAIRLSSTKNYKIEEEHRPYLELSNYFIDFGFLHMGEYKDTSIKATAKNLDQVISNINFDQHSDNLRILNPLPIRISKNESVEIKLRYTAIDTLRRYSVISIITQFCEFDLGVLFGSPFTELETKTLEIIQPNGGEVFYAGSDTVITWEGVSKKEVVKLNFSSDNGKSWRSLSDSSINLKERFLVPTLNSNSCLVSVNQELIKSDEEDTNKWLSSKNYGGSKGDHLFSITRTIDKGLIIAGTTQSIDGDLEGRDDFGYSHSDIWIFKIDEFGFLNWSMTFGGENIDQVSEVISTFDGGFLITGDSKSKNIDFKNTGYKGFDDVWVLKLNSKGERIWLRRYGGGSVDYGLSIVQTIDGGSVIVGYSGSIDGDLKDLSNKGNVDAWIMKLDAGGNIEWTNVYGGKDYDRFNKVINTTDNGFIVAGTSESKDGDLLNTGIQGKSDAWIMKLDSIGSIEWSKTFGGTSGESLSDFIQTSDGGYAFCGSSPPTNNQAVNVAWVVKLDSDGNLFWSRTFGSSELGYFSSLIQTLDGGLILAGSIKSSDGDYDALVVKYNLFGNLLWSKTFGGSRSDFFRDIIQTIDKNYIIIGSSESRDGDFQNSGYSYGYDGWILKLSDPNTPLQSDTSDAVFSIIMPEPVIQNNDIDMGQMIVGSTKDTFVSSVICNTGDAPLHVLGVVITGGDAGDFLIPRGAGDFYLAKDSCQDMMFEFTPSALGNRTAVATIRTTIGDFTDTINIRGVGIDPVIEATAEVVDFGVFELGEGKDTTVVLVKNVGTSDITITDTRLSGPDTEQFSLNTAPISYTISAGEEKEFQLNYTAKYGGKTNSFLDFHYDGIGSPIRSLLFAEGIGGEVYPQVPDAYVGEAVELGIYLRKIKPEGLSEIATNFSATVSYNSTLLAPIDKSILVTTEDNKSYINIDGQLNGTNQIAGIPMKVGLGTAVKSGLLITEFQLYDANGDSVDYDIEPGVGEFNVLGICEEGGVRLINPNGEAVDMVVTTDGLNSNARINLTLIEIGQTDLVIFDQIGNKIETVYSGTPSAGQQEINLNLSKYTNGRYYIKLTTPTITKTEIIEVVR